MTYIFFSAPPFMKMPTNSTLITNGGQTVYLHCQVENLGDRQVKILPLLAKYYGGVKSVEIQKRRINFRRSKRYLKGVNIVKFWLPSILTIKTIGIDAYAFRYLRIVPIIFLSIESISLLLNFDPKSPFKNSPFKASGLYCVCALNKTGKVAVNQVTAWPWDSFIESDPTQPRTWGQLQKRTYYLEDNCSECSSKCLQKDCRSFRPSK